MNNMTEKEKKEFLNLKAAAGLKFFDNETIKNKNLDYKIPNLFYKYKKFNEFSIEMLENEYLYLAPANTLDDPFDCLTSMNLDNVFKENSYIFSDDIVKFILNLIINKFDNKSIDKEGVFNLIKNSNVNGVIDRCLLENNLEKSNLLSKKDKEMLLDIFAIFQISIDTLINDKNFMNFFATLMNLKDNTGVCSLTTSNDNQIMWSLYSDNYCGYCVEYEIKGNIKNNLYPVIYTENFDNNIVFSVVKFFIETIIRFLSEGNATSEMGAVFELFCTKDKRWEVQDEWRIIGNPDTKIYDVKIKNIYLGMNISKENENKIIDLGRKKGINVYKMNSNLKTCRIVFDRIV